MLATAAAPLGVPLAYLLKDLCYAAWASDPPRASSAAHALGLLTQRLPNREIDALAAWTAGIAAISSGAMEQAVSHLDTAAAGFNALAAPQTAAATQVSKLIALAMLGRYEQALACGIEARDTLLHYGDTLAAGKIEQNLGTIAWRRGRYDEAEALHRAAYARFAAANQSELLVAAQNGLAIALASQLRVPEAAEHYRQALAAAQQAGLDLRQAEIECNLGNLALAQGRYDQALDYLERSRRRYAELDLPHELAFAEQELAEAYLELNLVAEAAAIYQRVVPTFASLNLRAEQAWALAHQGQALARLGRTTEAAHLLAHARQLFIAEENSVSAAMVSLFEAQLAYQRAAYDQVVATTVAVANELSAAGSHARALLARWLHAEAQRALGHTSAAATELAATLADAEQHHLPQMMHRCYTSLGLLAAASGQQPQAVAALEHAVQIIEQLRAPLPSEELRTAFFADKLGPYTALVELCLASTPPQVAEALHYAERARARTLAEMVSGAVQALIKPRDGFEAQQIERLQTLRAELNWLYSQLQDVLAANEPAPDLLDRLYAALDARETTLAELYRQLHLRGSPLAGESGSFDLAALQARLGPDAALVVYTSIGSELCAFFVTDSRVTVARALADEPQIDTLVGQLRFQLDAPRRNQAPQQAHAEQLLLRARHYLAQLYTLLLAPLEAQLGARRLLIIPHGVLHYVPFHALYDGSAYLIERREVCSAPSARVLQRCLAYPPRPRQRALFVGVPDGRAPQVADEVQALAQLFADPLVLLGDAAQLVALHQHAPTADILHLACHGSFRPGNAFFSALHLADGALTARDAYGLDLHCDLVVLSACETGVSSVAPGDELIGLVRGFFAAGTPALLVSLWMVEDASTARLMTHFYTRLRSGDTTAAALRAAQCQMLLTHPHPFYWAPFVLMGRW